MSNYPPGVTGNEYAIAGGTDYSQTRMVEHECDTPYEEDFSGWALVEGEVYGVDLAASFDCPQCGVNVNWDEDLSDEHNPY